MTLLDETPSAPSHAGRAEEPILAAQGVRAGYAAKTIVSDLDLLVARGGITALIGPNASGKSTLLGALSRLVPLQAGSVLLDGADIHAMPTREVARRLGILPQSPVAPEGITVAELVRRGRHPHRRFASTRASDDLIVARALLRTGVADLVDRPVDTLSGGQRQRAWIAMALAQETPLLLLDEPTSALDIAHQVEVLDLLVDLVAEGTTVVVVLHDLAHAARYASTVVALRDGAIVASGPPADVITADLVAEVFGVQARIIADPDTGAPLVLPRGRHGM
ncbi:ABC transporter ATP-binding protein [Mycetocola reblochoni]|uniref:ABC transporter ATP-binding protein n=1 Tax=Mycetocola reblochoni TaxID=331618 RepID=A0A3L6ZLR0_9MICO|nr:ABC transporter ATP-binding protein [Mycetocola reblochoni]RLP68768.1 ABC transporter ATP-binding protein [Mycetocola reblochoni]